MTQGPRKTGTETGGEPYAATARRTGVLGLPLRLSNDTYPEMIRNVNGSPVARAVSVDVALDLIEHVEDFEELRVWVAEHLNAIDLEDVDDDTAQVLSSLDYIVHGRTGCTEEGDYTPAQWRVLRRCERGDRG